MSKDFTEELRNFWGCFDEQLYFGALARMDFCADFCVGAGANVTNLTSRRAAQGLAWSRGGGG